MTLDDLIISKQGKEQLEALKGKEFGINHNDKYKRSKFVNAMDDFIDLEEYYSNIKQKGVDDIDGLNDLIGVIYKYTPGNPQSNIDYWHANPHKAMEHANELYESHSTKIAKFVENNRRSFMDKLSDEQLSSVFATVPHYKTNNKKYEKIRKLTKKYKEIVQASKEKKDISSVVQDELQEYISGLSQDSQEYIQRNSEMMIRSLTQGIVGIIQNEFNMLFKDEKGKLNKKEIKDYLVKNYKVVEDRIDDIPNDKKYDSERKKRWMDNLRWQYVALAKALFPTEKKDEKGDKDKDKETRKAEDRRLGLRT